MNKKVSELSGAELDYWVMRAQGDDHATASASTALFHCSWFLIGPIIEKHKICVYPNFTQDAWIASLVGMRPYSGTTPQLAACRAFVASVYGDSVCLSATENT